MGYRNIEPYEEYFLYVARGCGLFTPETECALGYGCKSISKTKDQPGLCRIWDCPLSEQTGDEDSECVIKYREVV